MRAGKGDEGATGGSDREELESCEELEQSGVWEDPGETESWERRRGGDWRVRPSGAGELRGVGAIGSMGGSGRDRELGAVWAR